MTKAPLSLFCLTLSAGFLHAASGDGWISYEPKDGQGKGKHVVLLAGDEEYRSEESLPMLAKLLNEKHGFKTTVLFSTNEDGEINPKAGGSLGRPETLDSADALVLGLRFRHWPDETMKKFEAALNRGVPVVALRTSTHLFNFPKESPWFKWSWNNAGGFGKSVLGETWISHWGSHGKQATRGIVEPGAEKNPLLNGVAEVFGPSDVYEAYPPADATILLRGLVLESMERDAKPLDAEKARATDKQKQKLNDPAMAVAWTREVKNTAGTTNKVMTTTMGGATDLSDEGMRRLVVNSVYWGLGLEVPAKADVTISGYEPSAFRFDGFKKGVKAQDLE